MRGSAIVLALLAATATAAEPPAPGSRRVAGRAMLVTSVCGGGAAISREQIARLPSPQPIANREFLVVAGEEIRAVRPAARFITRGDGSFVTHLPLGKWCFFDAARKLSAPAAGTAPLPPALDVPGSPNLDARCLEQQKHRCDLVLAVKADLARADITVSQGCPQSYNQPCYRGPMPP